MRLLIESKKVISSAYSSLKKSLEELEKYKKIARTLLVMMNDWNLTKCGKNSNVRKEINKFKDLLEGEIK